MLKIKLARIGKKNQPQFRFVVQEARSKLGGKVTDTIGTYNPLTDPATVKLEPQKYLAWIQKGAQPTLTVSHLVKKYLPSATPKSEVIKEKK